MNTFNYNAEHFQLFFAAAIFHFYSVASMAARLITFNYNGCRATQSAFKFLQWSQSWTLSTLFFAVAIFNPCLAIALHCLNCTQYICSESDAVTKAKVLCDMVDELDAAVTSAKFRI